MSVLYLATDADPRLHQEPTEQEVRRQALPGRSCLAADASCTFPLVCFKPRLPVMVLFASGCICVPATGTFGSVFRLPAGNGDRWGGNELNLRPAGRSVDRPSRRSETQID